jgi:tetratricopeptide (TPR) repeat protein
MSHPSFELESVQEFWAAVEGLLDAGRWSDATVTVHALARQQEQSDVLVILGTLLYERGQRHRAVREWTEAVELSQTRGQWSVAAAAHHNLAAMYRDLGDYPLARTFQQRAMSLQSDCGPAELLQLGNDAVAAERWELAESLFQAAAEMTTEGDPLLIDLAATRGVLCGFEGEPMVGLRWLQQAYREHVETGDHGHAGKDLVNAAALLEQVGRPGWARSCLELAQAEFELAGDEPSQGLVHAALNRIDSLLRVARVRPEWN